MLSSLLDSSNLTIYRTKTTTWSWRKEMVVNTKWYQQGCSRGFSFLFLIIFGWSGSLARHVLIFLESTFVQDQLVE